MKGNSYVNGKEGGTNSILKQDHEANRDTDVNSLEEQLQEKCTTFSYQTQDLSLNTAMHKMSFSKEN